MSCLDVRYLCIYLIDIFSLIVKITLMIMALEVIKRMRYPGIVIVLSLLLFLYTGCVSSVPVYMYSDSF